MTDLSGRVVLVTGGNGGIGLGMAAACATAGARIVIWGRNADKNDAAVERLRADSAGFENERFRGVTTGRTPVRRWADPSEMGPAAVYLADPTISFHTGDTLVVDGGYTVFCSASGLGREIDYIYMCSFTAIEVTVPW